MPSDPIVEVIKSPGSGVVDHLYVTVGHQVQPGDDLCVVERRPKEQWRVHARRAGLVSEVRVHRGDNVTKGDALMVIIS